MKKKKKEPSYLFLPHWQKDFISNSKRIHSFFRPLFWFGAIHHRAITRWWCVTLIHPYIGNALMIWQAPKSPESCRSRDVLLKDTALMGGKYPGTQQWENYIFWLQNFLTINNKPFPRKETTQPEIKRSSKISYICEYTRDTKISMYLSGSLGYVVEEVPDKKMISEVPGGLLNLFLAGNQGAYGCMCHWCRFHQCPKISSVKTWVKRKMTESGERHPLQHCWQMSKPFRGQFVNIYQNLKHAYSRPSNIISKNLSCRYSHMYRKIYMCENIYCSKGCNEKKKMETT